MASYRKYIPIGLVVAAVGASECKDGFDTLRTGIPVYTYRYHHAMQWQDSLGVGVLTIALGISVLSTSRGIMSDRQARAQRVGGELLCRLW